MSVLYDKGRQKFLEGAINWLTHNIRVCLIDTSAYTPDYAADEFLSAIPGGAIVATSANLSGKTTTGGVADANDVTLTAVSGPTVSMAVIYRDTGSAATSPLICVLDSGVGLPMTPNSGDIIIKWDDGPSKIFKL